MLCISRGAHYVHEPFAPMNHRSWLGDLPEFQYLHEPVDAGTPSRHAHDLQRIADLRPRWWPVARRSRSWRDGARLVQQVASTARARRSGARAIIKDPFALLAAEWIAQETNARVVVLVRHPAAFVSSILRLGWRLDERWLLGQTGLVDGRLAGHRGELQSASDLPLLEHACLTWRVLTSVINDYAARRPDWRVLRYEDLALDPVDGFRDLHGWCGLPFDDTVADELAARNDPRHGVDVPSGRKGGTRRDSRKAVWTWRDRLDGNQVRRVRDLTLDVAEPWYASRDWWESPDVG